MKVKKETFDTNMLNKIFFENEKIFLNNDKEIRPN